MSGKEGKEGKVYSLIGEKGEYFGRAPLRFDQPGKESGQNIPHIPPFPTAGQQLSQQMEANAPERPSCPH
jgi:hypothetical protein